MGTTTYTRITGVAFVVLSIYFVVGADLTPGAAALLIAVTSDESTPVVSLPKLVV